MSEQDDIQPSLPAGRRGERIEAYVSGKLAGDERARFEEELAHDAALREDVELERLLRDTIRNEDVMRFRDRVKEVTEEQEALADADGGTPVVPIERSRSWAYLAAAASVALVVTFAWWQWGMKTDHRELAMACAREFTTATRGDSSAVNDDGTRWMQARDLLLHNHTAEAIALLTGPATGQACSEAQRHWLLALAYLLNENAVKADAELDAVIAAGCEVSRQASELKEKL